MHINVNLLQFNKSFKIYNKKDKSNKLVQVIPYNYSAFFTKNSLQESVLIPVYTALQLRHSLYYSTILWLFQPL